jgi:multidrug resistance efflux pump
MRNKHFIIPILIILGAFLLTACDSLMSSSTDEGIIASGVIEADEISVSSEISGKVDEVYIMESDQVEIGDLLFTLEDDFLQKQLEQAKAVHASALAARNGAGAGLEAAQAALKSAESGLVAAAVQYEQVLALSRETFEEDRIDNWNQNPPRQIDLPSWYFQQSELIAAAEVEVDNAWDFLQTERENLLDTISDIDNEEYNAAEKRLAEAQAAFIVADQLNDHRVGYEGKEHLEDFIDTIFDKAETELEAAQKSYDQILSDPDYDEILEVRARVSVAMERYNLAQDSLSLLLQGEFSLEVQAAEAIVAQAEAGLLQAKAQVLLAETALQSAGTMADQARVAQDLVELQVDKLKIFAPISGTVLTKAIKNGEIVGAGMTSLTIANLEELSVTVYLPENRYGQVGLGDPADLRVDSFPDNIFKAVVVRIADQAEYTPRNVQTQEERQNTVYAIKLTLNNPAGKLKPGMPADVSFLP